MADPAVSTLFGEAEVGIEESTMRESEWLAGGDGSLM